MCYLDDPSDHAYLQQVLPFLENVAQKFHLASNVQRPAASHEFACRHRNGMKDKELKSSAAFTI